MTKVLNMRLIKKSDKNPAVIISYRARTDLQSVCNSKELKIRYGKDEKI